MTEELQARFYWYEGTRENVARSLGIRNTVIGTLLQDLSEGRDLETAVKSFEVKVRSG
ncbi:hypothetical protein G379_gp109 [Dickeya phage vB-DsoM-LIMEstone1]|nr:hypothetical protein G379_gp109 [Dickeya phage vB-DsoM-LIMEstone1]YP_009102916.1 hypothetical protein DA66_0076 [Dickeya phage RC-2014]AHZ60295.1 hypothetical protein DA66_0076 [Dickeya phage RC-2014]AIM51686.1 hypothetical protein HQ82_0161 [Dickeya phage phiDP10.3]CCD57673.1 hypothetical protein [Dickeya phage vB-DsoM-LIMEstone1]